MKSISVIIPLRRGNSPEITLSSLARQTATDFDVVVSHDAVGNANWARNRGAEQARTSLLLFSDDDIRWEPDAISVLRRALDEHPEADYSYGSYAIGNWIQCNRPFSADRLRRANYVSTMSMVRRAAFPGFDERLVRLQDWDLWLTMLENGSIGVSVEQLIFRTEKGRGITYGDAGPSYLEAKEIVRAKHEAAGVAK